MRLNPELCSPMAPRCEPHEAPGEIPRNRCSEVRRTPVSRLSCSRASCTRW